MNRRNALRLAMKAAAAGVAGSVLGVPRPRRSPGSGNRPNILLLFSDQHNASVLGSEGHPDVKTPNLDRLAASGVQFGRAYCQDGVCVPSRTSLMTGQYCRTTGVLYNPDVPSRPERLTTLARLFRDNGYHTAAFGKRHLPDSLDRDWDYSCTTLKETSEPSDEYYRRWVREHGLYEAFEHDWNAEFGNRVPGARAAPMACLLSKLPPDFTMEAYTARKTIDYIREAKTRNKPFFCWSSFYRPHQPYTPQRKYADRYPFDRVTLPLSLREPASNLPPLLRKWRTNSNAPWCLAKAAADVRLYRMYIAYYCALVNEIDDHVGNILETLDEEGLAGGTIVIYTADHGDFVGAHGMIEKCALGHNVYEDTLRVPLIMRWPGRFRKGHRADDLTELVDLYPTLVELTGVNKPAGDPLPGRSLIPVLERGAPLGRRYAISENWSQLAVIGERFKLGSWLKKPEDGSRDMMFDREADPLEIGNLSGRPAVAAVEKEMREFMQDWMESTRLVPPIPRARG